MKINDIIEADLAGAKQDMKVSKIAGNKATVGNGIEIDLDQVEVNDDPTKPGAPMNITPKQKTVGPESPKSKLKVGSDVNFATEQEDTDNWQTAFKDAEGKANGAAEDYLVIRNLSSDMFRIVTGREYAHMDTDGWEIVHNAAGTVNH